MFPTRCRPDAGTPPHGGSGETRRGRGAGRIPSKFDLRRLCRAVGATALSTLGAPRPEELGYAALLEVREVGGANVTVLSQVPNPSPPLLS